MDLTELDLERWAPWSPEEVMRLLEGVDVRWYVLAGWALDLFHGRRIRGHEDIEIGIRADDFELIRGALSDYELFVVGEGRAVPASAAALAWRHQTWVREPASGLWRLDVIREPWDGDVWTYRRDPRVRLDGSKLVAFTDTGVPYCVPEVVLLFKATSSRPKDEADFRTVLPLLDGERRAWLAAAIELTEPGHRWLADLV